jgi:hypothetical protein
LDRKKYQLPSGLSDNNMLRDTITHTVFEEKSGGLRFAKRQTIRTDLTVALAMACLAATQRSSKSTYRWDVWDENFIDDDAPRPPPEPEPAPLTADANWWKGTPRSAPSSSADDRLRSMYDSLNNAIQWGLIK